jgi:Trk K+ transport system NAD-binding subunit
VDRADVDNIHIALRAHEINPNLRLVIRFSNMSLGFRIRELFPGSVVLSDAATAGSLFVDAALGQVPASHAELPGRDRQGVYVTRRSSIPSNRILLGLADTSAPFGQRRLPADDQSADLVLARATGPIVPDPDLESTTVDGSGHGARRGPHMARARLGWRRLRGRRPLTAGWARTRAVLSPKLALASLGLLGLLVLGTAALAVLGESWGNAAYVVVLDAAGAAQPDTSLSAVKKVLQAIITVTGITFIPVVTAAFVDAVVKARLATALGRPPQMRDHVVVVGLGLVGAQVLRRLHHLSVPVIGVEINENARGVRTARRRGIPVVIGDATRQSTLRDAQLATCQSLLGVTNDDVDNLEAGLHGQAMKPGLRVVLRLFDDDLAERVERSFGITTSRSVSFLAAPTFAAAMIGRQILATIPVGRQVLLIAELPIGSRSAMVGLPARAADMPHTSRVIAVQRHGVDTLQLPAPAEHLLDVGDRLVVVATRSGLSRLISWSSPARAVKPDDTTVS